MNWLESLNSILSPDFINLIVAAGVGLIIGLEREFNTHDEPAHVGGIRTFMLVAILGNVADWVSRHTNMSLLAVILAGFILLVSVAYYVQTQKGKLGLTTETALLLTFLLGIAISEGLKQESLAVVVLMTVVLSLKQQLHGFIQKITEEELFAFIKFIVLALLILPLLPDRTFGPENMFNAQDLGIIALLVLSISFAGYILLRFSSPQKGILLTALIGGLFSSTLIAWVFSAKSRSRPELAPAFGAGIVLASSIMFIRAFIWAAIFAFPVALHLIAPLTMMLLISLVPAWRTLRTQKKSNAPALSPGNPLDVKNAIYFILLYVGITLLMWGSRQWFGHALTYLSAALAGVADVDAITISTSKWAASATEQTREAAIIILLAIMSNSIFKWMISLFNGTPEIRKPVGLGFGLALAVGAGWLLFWFIF